MNANADAFRYRITRDKVMDISRLEQDIETVLERHMPGFHRQLSCLVCRRLTVRQSLAWANGGDDLDSIIPIPQEDSVTPISPRRPTRLLGLTLMQVNAPYSPGHCVGQR